MFMLLIGVILLLTLYRHAIVEELATLGAYVHTCARNEDELEKCLRGWRDEEGLRITGSVCNVSSQADREKLLDTVSSVFNGKLNVLVCLSIYFTSCSPFSMF